MKLLFVTRTLGARGGSIVVANILRKLQEQDIAFHFVAFKPAGTQDFAGCEHVYKGIRNIEIIEVEPHDDDNAMINAYIDASAAYIKKHQHEYDKVILDSWYTAISGVLAQADPGKTYQLVQSDPFFEPENDSVRWKARVLELIPYFPLQRLVVSKSIQQLFATRYGQKYPVINLFVDDAYRRADFSVTDRPFTRFVTSAADFNIPSKGLDFLLEALQELPDNNFSLTILTGKPLKRDISRYDFPIAVASASGPEQMVKALLPHDVYVNTSTKETFCLALAEAITLGMPAIALDSVGNRDYVHDNNFIFVKDQKDFADQLQNIRNLSVRKLLHHAARPSMDTYSLDKTVEQFKEAIGL